jgi:hypothetical protein
MEATKEESNGNENSEQRVPKFDQFTGKPIDEDRQNESVENSQSTSTKSDVNDGESQVTAENIKEVQKHYPTYVHGASVLCNEAFAESDDQSPDVQLGDLWQFTDHRLERDGNF